jgi:hypothetical protein
MHGFRCGRRCAEETQRSQMTCFVTRPCARRWASRSRLHLTTAFLHAELHCLLLAQHTARSESLVQ